MNELPDHKTIGETLAPEEEQMLVDLGALGWPPEDIARSINANVEQFTQEYNDPNSRVAVLIARGLLQKRALLEIKLMDEALAGNIPATTQLYKVQRDRSFEMTKLDVFGGFTDEQSYQRIMDYIDKGCEDDLSAKEQLYIDLLNLVFSLSKQHDRRNVIKFLTKPPFKLSYARAVDIYDEAVNLFYSNRRVTKEALRQKYADDLEAWSSIVAQRATCAADYAVAADMRAKAAKILRLDHPDPEQLPPSQYVKPIRLLSLDSSDVSLPPANRDALSRQIDSILAPDAVKKRLRMEAGIEDVDFIEIINVAQEEN